MKTRELIEACGDGYGWADMSYIYEQTDDPMEIAEKIINEMYKNNEIKILTVKEVRDQKINLQDFDEFYESNEEEPNLIDQIIII